MSSTPSSSFFSLSRFRANGSRRKRATHETHRRARNLLRLSPNAELLEQKLVLTDPGIPLTTLAKGDGHGFPGTV